MLFNFRKISAGLTFAAIAATLLFQTSILWAAQHGPLRITFHKCVREDGNYEGTWTGDLGAGDIVFLFESAVPGEVIWKFSGYYIIRLPDSTTITIHAAGIDNLRSGGGHDVLSGEVVDGYYSGAQVQVRAQDTDNGACAEGTITITPSN